MLRSATYSIAGHATDLRLPRQRRQVRVNSRDKRALDILWADFVGPFTTVKAGEYHAPRFP